MSTHLAKVGLWGGNGGSPVDIDVPPKRLISLTIRHGTAIDAISFAYVDRQGNTHSTPLWGGGGGTPTQILLGPQEYVKEISGTYGKPFDPSAGETLIVSLNIVTTITTYTFGGGPIVSSTTFSIPVQNGGQIVGFFGRSGSFLDAIGIYIRTAPEE